MNPVPSCPMCGGPLIERNRPRLLGVGIGLLATGLLPLLSKWGWIPAIIGCLTGLYLIAWATIARGRWCRQCKAFPLSR